MLVRAVFKSNLLGGYDEAQILDFMAQTLRELEREQREHEQKLAEVEAECYRLQKIVDNYDASAEQLKQCVLAERAASKKEISALQAALREARSQLWATQQLVEQQAVKRRAGEFHG